MNASNFIKSTSLKKISQANFSKNFPASFIYGLEVVFSDSSQSQFTVYATKLAYKNDRLVLCCQLKGTNLLTIIYIYYKISVREQISKALKTRSLNFSSSIIAHFTVVCLVTWP